MTHPLIARQLRRAGVAPDAAAPSPESWRAFLERVERSYSQADQDRYTLERSLAVSSRELQELYRDLRESSETQLAQERDKLSRSLGFLHATQEAAPDGILVVDEQRRVVGFNRRFVEMWRIPDEVARSMDDGRLLGCAVAQLRSPAEFLAHVEHLYAHPAEHSHDEVPLIDGRVFERHSAPVLIPDGCTGARVWFFRDVTDRVRAREELRAAKEAAEHASRAKSEFLANMGHELRTPLNAILGFARVLEHGSYGPLGDRQRRYVQNICGAAEHMLALINDLLDLRRLEVGRESLAIERVSLPEVIEEAVTLVRPVLDARRLEIVVTTDQDARGVAADRRALLQVLVNLLSNAAKYTPVEGHITVRSRAAAGDGVTVEVADDGIGIREEDQPRLFNYFEQVGAKEAANMKGSGIGLALTRRLVEALGGTIGVASAPARGSTFHFTLPAGVERGA